MPRRHRCRGPAAPLLSRYPLTVDLAVAFARAAAVDGPALVVLVFDGVGALVACRPHDLVVSEVEEACRILLGLLGEDARGPAVLASVDPGFGCETEAALAVWREVVAAFDEAGAYLLDWLLICDDEVRSVAAAGGES